MAPDTTVRSHPTLGNLRGLVCCQGRTVQFRGLKYADIPRRWADSILHSTELNDEEIDCTTHGPECPQAIGGMAFDISLVGDIPIKLESRPQSELECLHLVVTIPGKLVDEETKLPVLVLVHGGGLSIGANSWPQYDLNNLVTQSVTSGRDIIGVSINYRLGPFGFMASKELESNGNFGYKDQALAFNWIIKYISGFGGDPENITAVGESAGSISISTLLLGNDRLFNRAIMMSGDATLRKPRKLEWHNRMYAENMKLLQLNTLTPEERILMLRTMPAAEMVTKLPMAQHWSAVVEGQFLSKELDLGVLCDADDPTGKPEWCQAIVVGDILHDGTIMKGRVLDDANSLERLYAAIEEEGLVESLKKDLLESYRLRPEDGSKTHREGLLDLSSDFRFYMPVMKVAEGWLWTKKRFCYTYHFHQINSVPGDFTGYASHAFDLALLLQNFNPYLPDGTIKLSKHMVSMFVNFACDGAWPAKSGNSQTVVLGPNDACTVMRGTEYDTTLRKNRGRLMSEIGWQKCFHIAERLQGVLPDS